MDSSPLLFPTTAIAGIFAFSLIFYRLFCSSTTTKSKGSNKYRTAPEAGGAWPIIGHLNLLGEHQVPHLVLGAMADKYGPIFTIRIGMRRALVVSNWEMAKECHTTNDKAFASRPNIAAIKHMSYNGSMFGLAPYGPYWREVRKMAVLELLSNHRLEMLKHIRDFEVDTSIRELYQFWVNKKNGAGSVLVEMKHWFGDLTFNIVIKMVAGKRYFGTTTASDNKEAQRCQKAMRDFFTLMGLFVVADALPFLGWLDLQGYEKKMKKTAKELDSILQEWLDEHRQKRLSGETKGEQDFMDAMLSILEVEDATISGYEADTINKSTCMTLILAGSDTTLVTLTWAVSLLLNNPHTLKRAQDELDIHVGKERHVDESDINNLVYLQAIIKETLRLYPAAPLSGPHEAMEDCTVAGYHVPAGTQLMVNLSKIQRDPRMWVEPSVFQPERFLTSHVGVDVRGQHFELIPFGIGRRSCPGISFALRVVQLSLARLLHAFELTTPSGTTVDMSESAGTTNLKATPLEVLLTPRLPPKLYEN